MPCPMIGHDVLHCYNTGLLTHHQPMIGHDVLHCCNTGLLTHHQPMIDHDVLHCCNTGLLTHHQSVVLIALIHAPQCGGCKIWSVIIAHINTHNNRQVLLILIYITNRMSTQAHRLHYWTQSQLLNYEYLTILTKHFGSTWVQNGQ